jgi:hypothetical protein
MAIRQTRMYAPTTAPYDNQLWAETMMARIIKTLVEQNPQPTWLWFTRYASLQPEFGDSDGNNAPASITQGGLCKSLRFRYEIPEDDVGAFERQGSDLITSEGCWIADWRDYDMAELSSDRFIGEDRLEQRRNERLPLVKQFLESTSRLALHALVPADSDGRFRFEMNDNIQNPHQSPFFSLHHLFCNTTDVLLTVLFAFNGTQLEAGTRQYPPTQLPGQSPHERQIRF